MEQNLELIIAVVNDGFAGEVVKYANEISEVQATVVKGRGVKEGIKGENIKSYSEKESVFIVVEKDDRTKVMENICSHLGLDTNAQAMVFSLPITNFLDGSFSGVEEEPEEVVEESEKENEIVDSSEGSDKE